MDVFNPNSNSLSSNLQPLFLNQVNPLSLNTVSNTSNLSINATASSASIVPINYAIKTEGTITFNGNSTLDRNSANPLDDALAYAGKGFTINGNLTLPLQRDITGQPLKNSQGQLLPVNDALDVSSNYQTDVVNGNNNYAGLKPPQIVPTQTVTLPTYNTLKSGALTPYNNTTPVTFNASTTPLNSSNDWTQKFPSSGLIQVTGSGLNIPSGVNISNSAIIVSNGDINFNGSGSQLNNVILIANNGNINLNTIQVNNSTILANNNLLANGAIQVIGNSLLANNNSSGVINFNGNITENSTAILRVVAAGNLTFNSSITGQGSFLVGKDFSSNGNTTITGNLAVKGNTTFNGGINFAWSNLNLNPTPTITTHLTNDTGISSTDLITSDAHLQGTVTGNSINSLQLEVDQGPYKNILPFLQTNGSFSLNPSDLNLTDGNHTITIVAQDIFGGQSTPYTFNFTLQTSTSTPTLFLNPLSDTGISNSDGITSQTKPILNGTASPNAIENLFDGTQNIAQTTVGTDGKWQITSPSLTNGIHSLTVVSTDIAGNVSQASTPLNITIDTLPPQVQLAQPLNNAQLVNNSHLTGQLNGTGSAVVSASYQWGNQTAIPLTITNQSFDNQINFTGINNGTQQLTLSLVDVAGNTFTQTYSVIVALDKTPPVVTLNLTNDTGSSNTDHITNNPSISGKVTDTSGVQSVKVSFKADLTQSTDITNLLQTDGTFTLNKTFLTQLNGGQLPDSNYQLYIQATDIYGNTTTTQNLPFQLLTQATTPTNLQLTPSSDTGTSNSDNITKQAQPTVTGIGSIGESIQLIDGNTVIGTTTVGNLGTWQITTNTLVDGIHNLTAKGTDIAGNISQASTPLNITIDTLPPQVQLAQPLNNAQLVNNSHLTGLLNGTGSTVVSASYQWAGKTAIPLTITLSKL